MDQRVLQIVLRARDDASAVLKKAGNQAERVGTQIKQTLANNVMQLGAAFAGATGLIVSSVKAFEEAETSAAQLNAVLKSTKGVAGVTADEVKRLSSALQPQSRFSDEAVTDAQSLLLTFTNIGKNIFPQATKTVLDMSQALGQGLKSSSIQLGKALQDPILGVTALRRVGVNFNETQQETIKKLVESGHQLEAQKLILKELATEFGGSAVAASKTFGGQLIRLRNNLNDVQETMGKGVLMALSGMVGGIDGLNAKLRQINDYLNTHKEVLRGIGMAAVVVAATFGGLFLAALIAVAGAAGPVIVALGALLSAIGYLVGSSGTDIRTFAANMGRSFDYIRGKVSPLIERLTYMRERLKQILSAAGISGEFGGLIAFFDQMAIKSAWAADRIKQKWQDVKNVLAFGSDADQGASSLQALEGIWIRIKTALAPMQPLFDHIGAQLALTGQIIQTQVAPAFNDLMVVLGPLIKELLPYLKQLLIGAAVAFGILLVAVLTAVTAIVSAFANALPYIAQAIEGIIQFFRGFVQLITGLIRGDFGLAFEDVQTDNCRRRRILH